jgi:ABC-type histidine transport system ATPase subunit
MHFLEKVKIPEQADKYPGAVIWWTTAARCDCTITLYATQIMLFDEPYVGA